MVWQIAAAKSLIERAAGQAVALFRPPYEGRTPAVDREARALGLLEVLWSVDSADSLGANYAGIEHNVITGVRPGSIVLMHENRGQTIRGLPAIFAALARDHLKPVTIPELVAEDRPRRRSCARAGAGAGSGRRERGTESACGPGGWVGYSKAPINASLPEVKYMSEPAHVLVVAHQTAATPDSSMRSANAPRRAPPSFTSSCRVTHTGCSQGPSTLRTRGTMRLRACSRSHCQGSPTPPVTR